MSTSYSNSLNYNTLDQALVDVGVGFSAAETHGVICGVSCVPDGENSTWIAEILEGADPEVSADSVAEMLISILESTRAKLTSTNFEFEPLLPADNEALEPRSVALGEWCTGFLFGLTLARGGSLESLPEDSREVLEDLTQFATIRTIDSDDEQEEAAFHELVEYIRVGVILISEELYASVVQATSPTLH